MYFDAHATGKRIQKARKAHGLTQEQFAIKLNISDRHLGRIERGECAASIDLLVEVAVSLKTTLDFLICGVTETPRERELSALFLSSWIATGIFPFTIMEDCTVHSPCSAP